MIGCPLCNLELADKLPGAPAPPPASDAARRSNSRSSARAMVQSKTTRPGVCGWSALGRWLAGAALRAGAQNLTYAKGQNVSPAYEGWEEDSAGRKFFVFGYMNRNWQEELDVPVGPDNRFTAGHARPGPADALPAAA